jgi:hypothetical protein
LGEKLLERHDIQGQENQEKHIQDVNQNNRLSGWVEITRRFHLHNPFGLDLLLHNFEDPLADVVLQILLALV